MISFIFFPCHTHIHLHTHIYTYIRLRGFTQTIPKSLYSPMYICQIVGIKPHKSPFSSPPTLQSTYKHTCSGCADSYTITNLPTPPFPPLPYTHTLTHTCIYICQVARIHTNQERLATYLTEGVLTEELLLDNGHQVCK